MERSGEQEVIRVQPGHHLAPGQGKALVDGVGLPLVRFAEPALDAPPVLADDLQAAVGGAAVHHDVFQVGIVLAQHALEGLLQIFGLVAVWRNYGNQGARGHESVPAANKKRVKCQYLSGNALHNPRVNSI